jgi:ankyrin repeat protein
MSAEFSPITLMWTAAQKGVLQEVLPHVCTATDRQIRSALLVAASNDHAHVVAALIGAREFACAGLNYTCYTPALYHAACMGGTSAARVLLTAKASVNLALTVLTLEGPRYVSPLGVAAAQGHVDTVLMLLHAGADLHTHDPPLVEAAFGGHALIVHALVAAKADVHGATGRSALVAAAGKDRADVVKVLLDAGTPPDSFHCSTTPLMAAAVNTPLHASDKDKVIQALLDAKADVHLHVRPDGRGTTTACIRAVIGQQVGALKLLLGARVSVNAPQGQGTYSDVLLNVAARHGAQHVARALLRAKADVHGAAGLNAAGAARVKAPIYSAVTADKAAVVRLLLRAGADAYPCLLQIATRHGFDDVARALNAHEAQLGV